MAFSNSTSKSITEIEEQIAKITAELEKARALEYAAVEKAFLAAQKRLDAARTKVNDLSARANTTPVAQSRLALAKAALTEQEAAFADAEAAFNAAKAEQDAADEFAKHVALVLSGKKLGKKVKLDKKEKAIVKEDKKAAKKLAKQEKHDRKVAKKQHKEEEKNREASVETPANLDNESVSDVEEKNISAKMPAKKAALPKAIAPAKKSLAKKAPVATEPTSSPAAVPDTESAEVKSQASLPLPRGDEDPAVETGHDVVVESETIPPAESEPEEGSQKPMND